MPACYLKRHALSCNPLPTPPQALASGQRVCVDLAFSHLMLDQENKSMCKQLGYCWHANVRAAAPAHLVLTSMEVRGQGAASSAVLTFETAGTEANCSSTGSQAPRLDVRPTAAQMEECIAHKAQNQPTACPSLPPQGQMEDYMARQVSGYKNWKATITPQVGR